MRGGDEGGGDLPRRLAQLEKLVEESQMETGRVAAEASIQISKARNDLQPLRKRVLELEAQVANLEEEARNQPDPRNEAYADELRAEVAAALAGKQHADLRARAAQQELAERDIELGAWQSRASAAEDEVVALKAADMTETLSTDLAQAQEEVVDVSKELVVLSKEIVAASEQAEAAHADLEQSQHERQSLKAEVDEVAVDLERMADQVAGVQKALDAAEQRGGSAEQLRDDLEARLGGVTEELEGTTEELERVARELSGAKDQIEKTGEKLAQVRTELASTRTQLELAQKSEVAVGALEALQESLADLRKELAIAHTELRLVKGSGDARGGALAEAGARAIVEELADTQKEVHRLRTENDWLSSQTDGGAPTSDERIADVLDELDERQSEAGDRDEESA